MAPSWTAGYVSDVAYTLGFYREMAPPLLDYALAQTGIAGLGAGPLRYCELGCGRGYGTALLAAANPDGQFVGVDFNPAHIGEARALAERAGLGNVSFLEASFGDAAQSADAGPGQFDVVALHGVYSWVSPDVREDIHEFLRRRLRPGGVVYMSYNCLPGWAPSAPVRELLKAATDRGAGDSLKRIAAAQGLLNALAGSTHGYIAQTPAAKQRIEMIARHDPAYIVHEYLNGSWSPLYVTEVMGALAEAKLSYAGSATIAENRDALCVPMDLAGVVNSAPDLGMRELLKDFAANKQFRRDIYVKGLTRLQPREAQQRYDATVLMLMAPLKPEQVDWPIPSGSAKLKPEAIAAIVATLADGPRAIGVLREAMVKAGAQAGEVAVVLDIMVQNAVLMPCRPDLAGVDRGPAARFNAVVGELAATEDTHRYYAAPVLGSAVTVNYFDRLAIGLGAGQAEAGPDEAGRIGAALDKAGKRLMRDGKPMEPAAAASEIEALLGNSLKITVPYLRALGALG